MYSWPKLLTCIIFGNLDRSSFLISVQNNAFYWTAFYSGAVTAAVWVMVPEVLLVTLSHVCRLNASIGLAALLVRLTPGEGDLCPADQSHQKTEGFPLFIDVSLLNSKEPVFNST